MMLRSSSTPVLGSLLASFSESPGNGSQHHVTEFHGGCAQRHTSSPKISCGNGAGYPNLGKSLFHSSPSGQIRRVQSEGNLGELVDGVDEFRRPAARKANWSNLEAIPSFSNRGQMGSDFDSDDEELESQEDADVEGSSNSFKVENLVLKQEGGRMYLASGLGVSGMSLADIGGSGDAGGRGGSSRPVAYDRDGGGDGSDRVTMEQHYRKMLEGDPGNPMVLRNYAQFLYQEKGDLKGAEEYYSRAILADPKDGEILSQYAKVIWELHHDEKRAACYFERAIQASAEDSHIQAAYASFLWDAEDEEEENTTVGNTPMFHHGSMATATA